MPTRHRAQPPGDERGLSVSVLVAVVIVALIMVTGLVIDGGQKITAVRRAETAAAGAARAAGNAVAGQQVTGRVNVGVARRAAQSYLAGTPGVTGTVTVSAGIVTVTTQTTTPTLFLSMVGIDQVSGAGEAATNIVVVGGR